jgi:hypothetical protein
MTRRYDTRIGQQLHQGGNTPGESNSIAKWLRKAFTSAAEAIAPGPREITRDNPVARGADFRNQFIPPEQPQIRGPDQVLNADGARPPDEGGDGTVGVPGFTPPQQGGGGDINVGGDTAVYGHVDLRAIFAQLAYLQQKVADHEYRITLLEARMASVERHPNNLRAFERRLAAIEKELEEAVECPP